jgi:hypothetical protein
MRKERGWVQAQQEEVYWSHLASFVINLACADKYLRIEDLVGSNILQNRLTTFDERLGLLGIHVVPKQNELLIKSIIANPRINERTDCDALNELIKRNTEGPTRFN